MNSAEINTESTPKQPTPESIDNRRRNITKVALWTPQPLHAYSD